MKMYEWKPAVIVLLSLFSLACSTAKKVPSLNSDELPPTPFHALSPRTVMLSVKNQRHINEEAGNAKEVEAALRQAVMGSLARGGLTVSETSKNKFYIQISDYSGPGAQGECLKLNAILTAKWGSTLAAESYACHYMKHWLGIQLGGDITEAYMHALSTLLQILDSKQMELLRR